MTLRAPGWSRRMARSLRVPRDIAPAAGARRPGALSVLLLVLGSALGITLSAQPLRANPGPQVAMTASAQPDTVAAGGTVEYSVSLVNSGDQAASGLALTAGLPAGFSYIPGSAQISFNGLASLWPQQDPLVSGETLRWDTSIVPDLVVPPKRLGNYYGIHTFVQDAFYDPILENHLARARSLTDAGGYVTQLLYPVTAQTTGASEMWKVFVQRACSKQLTPIVRLAYRFSGSYWEKPTLDGSLAQAFGRVVADLRTVLPSNCTMYVQVLNETNLTIEWSGQWPDPIAYGTFLVQVSNNIRSLGDGRIKILNAPPSPGGNYNNVAYVWQMLGVPGALYAWDAWASHPYPANHPASYNIHSGTATYPNLTVDSYMLEMQQISKRGRHVYDVLATETGYRLTDSTYQFEGYSPINDSLRAGFIRDAFQNTWTNWPELRAATPYELSDPARSWWQFDWLHPDTYEPYPQYTSVLNVPYKPGFMPDGQMSLRFQATAGWTAGTQTVAFEASSSNTSVAPASAGVYVGPGGNSPTPTPTSQPGAPTPTVTPVATSTETPRPSVTPTASATPIFCAPQSLGSFAVGVHPKGLAVDSISHRLHVGLFDSSRLAIFDTHTYGQITDVDTQGSHANGVAADADTGLVYVTNRDSANVSVIDGRSGAYRTRIGVGNLPFGVAAGGGRAYVANFGNPGEEGSVSVIDTASNAVLSTPKIGPRPALAAVAGGKGYVVSAGTGNGSGAIYSLTGPNDVASVETGYFAFGAAYLDGKVYATQRGSQTMVVVDATTNQVLKTISMPGPVYAAAANPASGHVFAVDAANDRVYMVDAASASLVAQISVGSQNADDGGQGIAVDTVLNKVFVANYAAGTVSVLADCTSGGVPSATPTRTATPSATRTATASAISASPTPTASPTAPPVATSSPTTTPASQCVPAFATKVALGTHPKSVAVDAAGGRVHVVLFDSSRLASLNGSTLATVADIALAPLGSSQPNAVAVDQASGRVYVTSRANANLAVIDGRTGTWLTRVNTGNLPFGVAAADSRAYVANFADNTVTVIDTAGNGIVGTVAVGSQPGLAAAGGGKGYVSSIGAGSLNIISGTAAPAIAPVPGALGTAYMDGTVYAGSRQGQRLFAVDPVAARVVLTVTLPGPAYAVAANPTSGHVFVVDASNDRLYVVDAETGSLIANLPLDAQDANDGGQGIAADPATSRVYVTAYAAGTLSVFDDCGQAQPPASPTATATVTVTATFGPYRAFLPVILHSDGAPLPAATLADLRLVAPSGTAPLPVGERGQLDGASTYAPSPSQGEGWGAGRSSTFASPGHTVAIDPTSGRAYVGGGGGRIAALDRSSELLAELDLGEPGLDQPGAMLAQSGRVYASFADGGDLVGADAASGRNLTRVSGLARPYGMALDETRGLLYVAEAGADTVAIIDVTDGAITERLKIGRAPYALALDAARHILYAATPGDKSVWIIHLDGDKRTQRVAVPGLGLTLGLTLDERGTAYLVYAVSPKIRAIAKLTFSGGEGGKASLVDIVQGDYNTPLADATGVVAGAGRLYVTDGDRLITVDATSGKVQQSLDIGVTAGSFGIAIEQETGAVVVADVIGRGVKIVD